MIQVAFWLAAIIGAAVILLVLVGVYVAAVASFLEWRRVPHQRSFLEGRADQRNRLMGDSWWFGESPETCELLRDLARNVDVSQAREKWRRAREAAAQMEAVQ